MSTTIQNLQQDDRLKKALGYSLALHAAVLIVFAVRVVFFPSEQIPIMSAIRVDMVALPDKQTARLPPAPKPVAPPETKEAAKEPPPPEPKKVELPKPAPPPSVPLHTKEVAKPDSTKVNLKKNKQDEASALKRLEALERLEKMTKAEKQMAAKSEARPLAPSAAPIKGNEISHGGALTGIARLDNDNYIQTVTDQVKEHWNLPRWLASGNFRAVVKVFVDSNGNVLKKQLILSSKNETFDERVMAAIESATPLPAPPSELVNRLAVYGIDLDLTP